MLLFRFKGKDHKNFKPFSLGSFLVHTITAAGICSGLLGGCFYPSLTPPLRRHSALPQGKPATLAKLNQVKPGMTTGQVVAIFGFQGYIPKNSSPTNPPYMSWTNDDLTGAIVMFENGGVVRVMQVGALE